ncbi:MAG: S-layer homology domain-containing protein, partial [Tissierellia bacterium]|nr:S-layer homology domain-containing protein [Tissierellia bacterium]
DPDKIKKDKEVTVTVTDKNNRESDETKKIVKENPKTPTPTKPEAPKVDDITEGDDKVVVEKLEDDVTKITIVTPDGEEVIVEKDPIDNKWKTDGKEVPEKDGKLEVPVDPDKIKKDKEVTVTVTDKNNRESDETKKIVKEKPNYSNNKPLWNGNFVYNKIYIHKLEIHKPYILGYPNGDFKPDNNITRAEVAMIFARLLGNSIDFERTKTIYSDVSKNHWASGAIKYLTDKGILEGRPDGTFAPQDSITRAEYATIIARMKKIEGGKLTFPDIEDHWAKKYIEACSDKQYILGYPNGTFKPDNAINRAEAVAMTNRMLNRKGDLTFIKGHLKKEMTFKDVIDTHWAYDHIYEASLTHEFVRNKDQSEAWIRILEKGAVAK